MAARTLGPARALYSRGATAAAASPALAGVVARRSTLGAVALPSATFRGFSDSAESRVYGGLSDADRIFTNLYHEQDPYLKGALARGDYYMCKEIIHKGRDWIIDEIKKSGLRGRGGAGF
eukprot:COSAG01_NODE_4459_length_5004_cov_24.561060_1_plen_119_part_10